MKFSKFLFVALVSLGLTLVAAPKVSAEEIPPEVGGGYVGLDFGDFRFPGTGCYNHTGHLAVYANDDYAYDDYWIELELTVTRDGEIVTSWFDTDVTSGDWSITNQFCRSFDRTGNYTVSGTVTFWDYDVNEHEVYVSDTFNVYAPHSSSVSIAKSTYGAHGWKVSGTVKYDGKAWAGKRVYFQKKVAGTWRTISSKNANSVGRVAFTYTPTRGTAKPYRLLTKASSGVGAKASSVLYLKRR